jgi:hypothetical protein
VAFTDTKKPNFETPKPTLKPESTNSQRQPIQSSLRNLRNQPVINPIAISIDARRNTHRRPKLPPSRNQRKPTIFAVKF